MKDIVFIVTATGILTETVALPLYFSSSNSGADFSNIVLYFSECFALNIVSNWFIFHYKPADSCGIAKLEL